MSTEARHAPIPPRPQAPPRPSVPPRPATPPDDTDDEPSVFTPRTARAGTSGSTTKGSTGSGRPASGGSPTAGRPTGAGPSSAEATARDGRSSRTGSGAGPLPRVEVPRPAGPEAGESLSPPPPPASARFPDAPPNAGREARRPGRDLPRQGAGSPGETATETTARLRPITASQTTPRLRPRAGSPGTRGTADASGRTSAGPGQESRAAASTTGAWSPMAPVRPVGPPAPAASVPDPASSWSAVAAVRTVLPAGTPARHRVGPRTVAAAACLVLGLGLIGGAVTGSWLTGDDGDDATGDHFAAAGALWHNVPVDQLFPPTVEGTGAGPGGADRTWTRIAVAPDTGCAQAFDPLLAKVLAPVGCQRLLRASYTDSTQSYVTTVGLLFTRADSAAMAALAHRFRTEHLDRRADLMPRPYAAEGTVAAGFGNRQRASWTISVLTDAPVVTYAVSGWADGRAVDAPQPAADAVSADATTAQAQAGLGNEAQGLADRIERRLRQHIGTATATENPS
ncbi:hypothetical protein [Streptomyces alanosinicus]|uniref:Uncharacterized protein n=1 Tax=Streptomyces alanosinicus TaxID=68171 RepID=A0A918YGA0_9ACTN|nr:hypothetical protein [Streptomyces alanosinicus]GHE02108.1 hypothetical protein GCM10010339_23860 [Streptomyces alanosinicus]